MDKDEPDEPILGVHQQDIVVEDVIGARRHRGEDLLQGRRLAEPERRRHQVLAHRALRKERKAEPRPELHGDLAPGAHAKEPGPVQDRHEVPAVLGKPAVHDLEGCVRGDRLAMAEHGAQLERPMAFSIHARTVPRAMDATQYGTQSVTPI